MIFLDKLIILVKTLTHSKKIFAIIFSLTLALFLWFFITYTKVYQQTFYCPVSFRDKSNNTIYFNKDSIISVKIKSIGFDMLFLYRNKNKVIIFDINNFSIDKSKGFAKIPTYLLRNKIKKELNLNDIKFDIYPDTIRLKWDKIIRKKVDVVSNSNFLAQKPFGIYGQPEILTKNIIVEGSEKSIRGIDTIYTEDITYKNINRNTLFMLPVKKLNDSIGINVLTKQIPIKINVEEFTENTITLEVKAIKYNKKEEIRLFPSSVKVKYRVSLKDYKQVNEVGISAYVISSADSERKKLKVMLGNVPNYVKIISIQPEKVEYVIFK